MNLIIDIGNSAAKIAVMDGDQIVKSVVEPQLSATVLERLFQKWRNIDKAILSTTRNRDEHMERMIEERVERFIRFDPSTPVPIGNAYETPETLGADRLAAAVGAWNWIREDRLGVDTEGKTLEILIVDFGSAITIDRVSAEGIYQGGNISPGMRMRFEALHRLTDRLPLCSASEKIDNGNDMECFGKNTRKAIEGGVIGGIVYEIEGYVARFETENKDFQLFFTGRDANFFASKLKKPIFVIHDLVIKGLNRILEYNTRNEDEK